MSMFFTDITGRVTEAGRAWMALHSLNCDHHSHEAGTKILWSAGGSSPMVVGCEAKIEDIARRARSLGLI